MTTAAALDRFFPPGFLERLERPLGESTALPNAAYTEAEFLQLERDRVFARTWMLAGFVRELPAPGSVLPVEVAGRPVVLVRDEAGLIRAFHNVCLHRGAQLVDRPCQGLRNLQCPNHHWSYRLDGRLRGRPHFFGPEQHDRDCPDIGLADVDVGVWHDLVFVNLDGAAQSFDAFMRPVTSRLMAYDLDSVRHAGTLEYELACNWKLVQENYIEPYHVFAVHPKLLEFGPMNRRRPTEHDGACLFNDYQFAAPQSGRASLPFIPGLDQRAREQAIWFHLFPSLSFEIFPDQFAVVELQALDVDRTRERIHIYLVGEAADGDTYATERQAVLDTWDHLNAEDITVIERMQRGRRSPGFDGGTLSPYWDEAVRHFARLLVQGLSSP